MADNTLDLTKLRAVAEAATNKSWNVDEASASIECEEGCIADLVTIAEDAVHIATFDPPTVLRMIEELERLRGLLDTAITDFERIGSGVIAPELAARTTAEQLQIALAQEPSHDK